MAIAIDFQTLAQNRPSLDQLEHLTENPNFYLCPEHMGVRKHSILLDKILGFRITKIEHNLLKRYVAYYKHEGEGKRKHYEGTQTWIGLHPQVLQTPYDEITRFLCFLKKYNPKKVVDLGAGYGRVGLVMRAILPEAKFIGFEIVSKRLIEAKRVFSNLKYTDCQMVSKNILDEDFEIPKADIYFIYDFSDPHDLRTILDKLSQDVHRERFFLVARGEGIRSLIQLKYPQFWVSHGAIHRKDLSIYSSFADLEN